MRNGCLAPLMLEMFANFKLTLGYFLKTKSKNLSYQYSNILIRYRYNNK